jgi:protein-S-isoprenylcysteine O-methyltransferase Ste14
VAIVFFDLSDWTQHINNKYYKFLNTMIETIVLIITLVLFLLVITVVSRAIITKQRIFGQPPIPVVYFLLAKMLVIVNLAFLLAKGLKINGYQIFKPTLMIEIVALALLIAGTIILILSTIQLNRDLIFGLSASDEHHLQTKGVYSLSRHPFYLGFIFILFSSCLLNPHFINILAFSGAWLIHHFIMIREEQFLSGQYGEEYRQYTKRVKRYITIK